MAVLGGLLQVVGGITSLVCFILVVVKIFQHQQTGLGIACIVLVFCCGIGGLIAYIYGWMKSGEWNLRNIMLIWTVAILLNIAGGVMNPVDFSQYQHQLQQNR
jgi:hypothetical protein